MRWTNHIASLYWGLWLLVGFGVPETWFLVKGRPQRTLSYQVWTLEGNGPTAVRFFIAAFSIWFGLHMTLRMFR